MKYRTVGIYITVMALVCMAVSGVFAQDDISRHRECAHCGMDRKAYGYSRMLIIYEGGTEVGVCSLHCAVTELDAKKGLKVQSILVADRNSHLLIDAQKATWVMGGKKRGVMTQQPKWAFGTKAAAQTFIDANGGTIVSWEEALASARQEQAPKTR